VASNGSRIWACGTDEGIASSSDGGEHWQIKHQALGGNLLLNVQFISKDFGFAAGTGGALMTSEDGGETWTTRPSPGATILQISLSDANHGIVRTPDSLLVTSDGGAHWSPVSLGDNAETLKQFPYTFSLAALDSLHLAVMLKSGSAQYESQAFLVSGDGGTTWKTEHVPNSTLYSFLARSEEYWAIGTEVIHRDQPGGGYAVPVAWHSPDGHQWSRSSTDLSACKMEMCVACKHEGCLSSNGTVSDIFSEKPRYQSFPTNAKLNSKWAAAENAICFAGNELQCAAASKANQYSTGGDSIAAAASPGPLGAKTASGPRCVSCGMDHFLVDQKVQGSFSIRLTIRVAMNGTVSGVEVDSAPSPEIRSRIEEQVRLWIFEPYEKDGHRVNLKLTTKVQVNVMRSR
jgi:hypothetical protein